jgi:uncharacterized small protein (DUF1192 family)
MITIQTNETWIKQEDGTMLLISVEEVEVDILTPEEEIAQKEAELLKMYKEIQDLKNNL